MAEQKEEERIKWVGQNIYYYYWSIVAFVILIIINDKFGTYKIELNQLDMMISVATFLFGFLVTVSFSMLLSRVSQLKTCLAIETGRLVSLLELSKHLGGKFHEKMRTHIDNYTVNTLRDYKTYEIGRQALYEIYEDAEEMELKTEFQKQTAASFFYVLGEFESNRENLEYLTQRGLMVALKVSNYLLGAILVGLLFLNRGVLFNDALFVILSTIVIFIILIIEDYEHLKIGDYTFNISNSEQIFDLIGVERYYPKEILPRVKLEKGKKYRIGVYDKRVGKEKVIYQRYG